jgi:hypothetical protein
MIVPKLKALSSPDLTRPDLPDDIFNCGVFCEAEIGPEETGGDIFSFTVVTPEFLKRENSSRWGRGYLVVSAFDWEKVELAVRKLLDHVTRETWNDVAIELSKELHSEFDNYVSTI